METTGDQPPASSSCAPTTAPAARWRRAWCGPGAATASRRSAPAPRRAHVRPEAIAVMGEIGIDISGHTSKTILPFLGEAFAWVITVCDEAKESCPVIPGAAEQAHWSIDDPSTVEGDEEERLEAFRTAPRPPPRPGPHVPAGRRPYGPPAAGSDAHRRLSLPLVRSRGDAPRSALSSLRDRRRAAVDLRPMRLALVRQSEARRRGPARAPGGRRCRAIGPAAEASRRARLR